MLAYRVAMEDTAIKVLCPTTNAVVSTGISLGGDAEATRSTEMEGNSFACPACSEMHTWDKVRGETMATVRV